MPKKIKQIFKPYKIYRKDGKEFSLLRSYLGKELLREIEREIEDIVVVMKVQLKEYNKAEKESIKQKRYHSAFMWQTKAQQLQENIWFIESLLK